MTDGADGRTQARKEDNVMKTTPPAPSSGERMQLNSVDAATFGVKRLGNLILNLDHKSSAVKDGRDVGLIPVED